MAEITGFGILQNLDVYYKAFVEGKVEIDLPFAYAKVFYTKGDLTIQYFADGEENPFAEDIYFSVGDTIKITFFGNGTQTVKV